MIAAVRCVLGEYRLEAGGCFVGTDHPDADVTLVMAEEVIEQLPSAQQPERDSLGFVWPTRDAATLALAQVTNRLWRIRP